VAGHGESTRLQYGLAERAVTLGWAPSRVLVIDEDLARLPGILPGHIMDAIGEQLAGSLEINATLQHVAEMLVPRFADHCFIDLFEGDALICRVRRHAGGWTPPPGTWKQVGEQIVYPEGHFCQRAMARLDTVIVNDLAQDKGNRYPPPSAQSYATAKKVGLTSVLSAPLYARGKLLGVMSLALSDLTDRTERHYAMADRYLIGAIASQVAIDKAITGRGRAPDRAGPSSIAPATSSP
jgi:GAF domain-containing protein